jgi:predicted HD phosphohydrolase
MYNMEQYRSIVNLMTKYGNEQYMIGENITQQQHALQSAWLGYLSGAPNHIVLGLLLHDIGQLTELMYLNNRQILDEKHNELGYTWLIANNFPASIANIAKFHPYAKIFLCEENIDYYNNLSQASKESLMIQKDILKYSIDWDIFINLDNLEDFLLARMCDDMAKMQI